MRSFWLVPVVCVLIASCSSGEASSTTSVVPTSAAPAIGTASSDGSSSTVDPVADTTATTISIVTPVFDPNRLPALPTPTALAGADPASRALELVGATGDDVADVGPGWLAAYAEFAVPVIDARGVSTIGGDPVGPHWDEVWAVTGMSRGRATVPLGDAGKVLGWDAATPADPATLLSDLRNAAVGADPSAQTLALFIQGRSIANGGADLLDPATTPEHVWLDAATIQLVNWVVARGVLALIIPTDTTTVSAPATSSGFAASRPVARRADSTPCAEILGSSDETSWINWVIGKLGGGIGAEGVGALPGVVELWVTQATKLTSGAEAAKLAGARAASVINKLNIAASLISLIAQVNALTINTAIDPDPLIRHRQASDGDSATIHVEVTFAASKFDGNDKAFCVLSLLSNALGVGLSLPADGTKLAGIELVVTPGQNFPDKVYFADSGAPKRVTDDQGVVLIDVQGHARNKTLPETAKEKKDEFGLNYAAQVGPVSAQTLMNVFIDGLQLTKGVPGAALDIAKTLHFDLGEFVYPFTDFETGYRIDQTWLGGGYRLTGEVCDLDKPFVIQADGSAASAYVGPLTITPNGGGAVSYSLVGTFGGRLTGEGSGSGQLDTAADPATLTLDGGSFTANFPAPIGNVPVGAGGAHFAGAEADPILLTPDPTTCGGS